ncbi:MAG TPA: pyridoxal kinase PdxY [Stellaceae bacterium]|nr:pyridoxal kinase PdxY [Stellaceae bacterium]
MAILSIQSAVAYGHVGNSVAVFPLQRLGFEVWPVDTVQFSNHTGYGAWRGRAWDADAIAAVIAGIGERGGFARCEAVLTGYLGERALGEAVLDAVAQAKAAQPGALYCCDPVIGDDHGGSFVRPGIAEFFRAAALAAADIVTPNRFELAFLSGRDVASVDDAVAAAAALRARGPRLVLATSLPAGADEIAMLAAGDNGASLVTTPRLPLLANGAGDLTAALFLGYFLRGRDPARALGETAAAVHAVIEATLQAGEAELQIVAAQEVFPSPPPRFAVARIG